MCFICKFQVTLLMIIMLNTTCLASTENIYMIILFHIVVNEYRLKSAQKQGISRNKTLGQIGNNIKLEALILRHDALNQEHFEHIVLHRS